MIVPVMAISNLVLTQQIYSEETNGAHAHYREPVPLITELSSKKCLCLGSQLLKKNTFFNFFLSILSQALLYCYYKLSFGTIVNFLHE